MLLASSSVTNQPIARKRHLSISSNAFDLTNPPEQLQLSASDDLQDNSDIRNEGKKKSLFTNPLKLSQMA